MTDTQRSIALVDQVKLMSIEPVRIGNHPDPMGQKVTFECDQSALDRATLTGERLTVTVHYPWDRITDEGIVAVARADFAELMRDLAQATESWLLTPEQRAAFETPAAKAEMANTVRLWD